jgi:predicted dehydrogenase
VGATKAQVGDLHVYRDVDGEIADYQPSAEPGRAHAAVVENFVRLLGSPQEWPDNDGSQALRRAEVIDACYLSAAEKREVAVA